MAFTKAGRYDENLLKTIASSGLVSAVTSADVYVFEEDGTTAATLYADSDKTGGAEADHIISPDSEGNLEFFANPGQYVLKIYVDGSLERTDTVIVPPDPDELEVSDAVMVYVDDFEPAKDGATDDSAAIQAAIDSLGGERGIVQFGRGTYKVDAGIDAVRAHLRGVGVPGNSGGGGTVLEFSSTFGIAPSVEDNFGFAVSDLDLLGSGQSASGQVLLDMTGQNNPRVWNVRFRNTDKGLLLAGGASIESHYSAFWKLDFNQCIVGAHLSGGGTANSHHFYGGRFSTCDTGMLIDSGVNSILVSGMDFECGAGNIGCDSTGSNITFVGCRFETAGTNLQVRSGAGKHFVFGCHHSSGNDIADENDPGVVYGLSATTEDPTLRAPFMGGNLVENGSGEQDNDGDGTPDGWVTRFSSGGGGFAVSQDATEAQVGSYAVELTNTSTENPRVGVTFEAEEGHTYAIRYMLKVESGLTVEVRIGDSNSNYTEFRQQTSGDDAWHTYTRMFTAQTSGTKHFYFYLAGSDAGSFFVDGVSVHEGILGPTTWQEAPLPVSGGTVTGDVAFASGKPWFDVTAFGAEGDGSTDDTAAIQAAIDAMEAADGGVVYIPSGIYNITSTLTVQDTRGPIIRGSQPGHIGTSRGAILHWGGSAGGTIMQLSGAPHAVVENLVFDGDTKTAGVGLEVRVGSSLISSRMDFRQLVIGGCIKGMKIGEAGENEGNNDQSTVTTCWFLENDIGISIEGDQHVLWEFINVTTSNNSIAGLQTGSVSGDGGAFGWIGGSVGANGIDFNIPRINDPVFIKGVRSENSGQFLVHTGNFGDPDRTVTIENCWQNSASGALDSVEFTSSNSLVMMGCELVNDIVIDNQGASGGTPHRIFISVQATVVESGPTAAYRTVRVGGESGEVWRSSGGGTAHFTGGGGVVIGDGSVDEDAQLVITGTDSETNKELLFSTGGAATSDRRWIWRSNGLETGSDVGSELVLMHFDDSGTFLGNVMRFTRASGKATFFNEIEIDGNLNHDGSTVGFYGASPTAKAGATDDIKDSLVALGLITDGGATPLDLDGGNLTATRIYTAIIDVVGAGETDMYVPFGVNGALRLASTVPGIQFEDTTSSALDFKIQVNSNALTIKEHGGGGLTYFTIDLDASEVKITNAPLVLDDGVNLVVGTTTGTQIGTAATQKIGFFGTAPVVQPAAYTPTNVTTDRSYDADATTLDEVADVLGTLIADLQSLGLIG